MIIRKRNWKSVFASSYMRNDVIKNLILFFSCIVAMSSLLLTTGFYHGSNIMIDKAKNSLVDSGNFQVSIKEYYDNGDSPIRLVRTSRPSKEEMAFLSDVVPSAIIANDYANLFPGDYQLLDNDEPLTEMSFIPVHSFTYLSSKRDLLVTGSLPYRNDMSDICVNEKAVERLGLANDEAIGHRLFLSVSTKITYIHENVMVEDAFFFESPLRICAVFRELSFLNVPKIFYSHSVLERMLEYYVLEDISEARQEETTCLALFSLLSNDDYLANYRMRVFVLDSLEIPLMDNLSAMLDQSDSSIVLTSDASLVKSTYEQLTRASFYSMLVFAFVAMLGTGSIMAIGSFSNYVFNKKDSAILSCLGARRSDIHAIFLRQSMAIICLSALISVGISMILQQALNTLLERYVALERIIAIPWQSLFGIPFALPLILLIVSILFSLVFTIVPLSLYKAQPILQELRDQ
ncbi:MAG: FtsX-like permease family protein [Bacteroidia bacterium]|nr:FtsX-like permease family protein [Bacteroidia bacterium]